MTTPDKGGAARPASQDGTDPLDTGTEGGDGGAREGQDKPVNPRDEVMARMEERINAERETEAQRALDTGHPMAVQVEADRRAKQIKPASEAPVADEGTEPPATEVDPLADVIVVKDGKATIRLKVDGQDREIPLETARAQLQKGVAAEVRMQQAAEQRKQNDTRAEQLRQQEAALTVREQKLKPSQPSSTDADDQALAREAKDLVSSLMSDSEEEAATKLAAVLKRTRQAPAPSIDADEIARRVVTTVTKQQKAEKAQTDLSSGFDEFARQYPEMADEGNPLFKVADSKSETIAQEHPEWSPSQILLEAGKQTKEWVDSLKGGPAPTPTPPTNDRQNRKQNLKPLPAARTAVPASKSQDTPTESPSDIVAAMRKSRGQAV